MSEPNKPANVFPILIVVAVAAGLLFIAIGKVDRGDSTEVNVNVNVGVAVEPSLATESIPTTLPPEPPITSPPVTAPNPPSPPAKKTQAASTANSVAKPSPPQDSSTATSALALKRFLLRHGDVPKDLEELVPEFVSAVPMDAMDGEPLRYRRTGSATFLLYSVGEDMADNNGDLRPVREDLPYRDIWDGRDVGWPIAAPPK